jgi:hypothetical protein
MIKQLTFFLSFLIACAGYSQPEFVINKAYDITRILKGNPSKAEKLWMKCNSADIDKLKKNVSLFTNLTEIAIIGGNETDDWNELLESVSKIPSLHKVSFVNNNFDEIPSSTALLKQINSIDYYGSQQAQFDSCVTTLEELTNLKELSFDLYWVDDIPSHLYLIKGLQSVTFRFSMDFNQEFTAAGDIEDTLIEVICANRSFSIKLVASGNSLTVADIQDVRDNFPAIIGVKQPPIGTNPVLKPYEQTTDYVFNKSYKNIHPPISKLTVQKTYYSVNTDSISIIQAESGTTLKIPQNAFVDKEGKAVTGQVLIDYREFKDPLDFIFSGIPMSFDSGSQHNLFMSAGMFEINASVNGKEVFLKKGKKIGVDFAATDSSSGYTLFSFNDSTGHWNLKQDSLKMKGEKKRKFTMSGAVLEYSSLMDMYKAGQNKWMYPPSYDSTLFNDRFTDTSYVFLWKKHWYDALAGNEKSLRSQLRTSNVKITNIRKSKNGDLCFYLRTLYNAIPELIVYHNSYWKLDQKMSKKELKAIASNKNRYSDARIEETAGGFVIKLKTAGGFKSLIAHPVKFSERNYTISYYNEKELSRLYKSYSRKFSLREIAFNRSLVKGRLRENEIPLKPEEIPYYTWKHVRGYTNYTQSQMTREEKSMKFDEWKTYAAYEKTNEKALLDSSQANSESIISSFSIDGMGIWNCDQVRRLENPVEVYIQYKNKSEKNISPATTYN